MTKNKTTDLMLEEIDYAILSEFCRYDIVKFVKVLVVNEVKPFANPKSRVRM